MMELLGLLIAVLIGYGVIRLTGIANRLRPLWAARLLEVTLGIGAGAGLTSVLFFLMLAVGAANRWTIFGLELIALIGLGAIIWRREQARTGAEQTVQDAKPGWRWNWLLGLALGLAILLVSLAQLNTARISPYGEFDAFAIWNVRAQFMLGDGDTWQRAYSPMLVRQHPDYPLLLSSFIARTWRIGGDQATAVAPFGTAMLFIWGAGGLLVSSLALLRGLGSALLAAIVLIANAAFLQQSTWQYADIPVSLFMLGTIVLIFLGVQAEGRQRNTMLAVSGVFASLAAMTKNEGIPFLLLAFGCYFVMRWRLSGGAEAWKSGRIWLAGALPGTIMQAYFKLFLAPTEGPFAAPPVTQMLGQLADIDRYMTVFSYLLTKAVAMGSGLTHPIVLLLILAVVLRFEIDARYRPYLLASGALLILQLLAYCGIYLTTQDDLIWRLDTSLGRLYSQLWPLVLLTMFMMLGVPRDAEEAVPEPDKKKESGKRKKKGRRLSG